MKIIKKNLQIGLNINDSSRKFYLIFTTISFAFVFLNIFEPFGLYYDKDLTQEEVFIELFIALIIAFIILLFSQFILRQVFKIKHFTVFSYILWFLLESVLVATAWFFLDYADNGSKPNFLKFWFENFFAYVLIMSFPYFLFAFIVHLKDLAKENISLIKSNNTTKTEQLTLNLKDETDVIKLVIKTENLLYIQSADNYLEVHYIENDKLSKFLLRNSMKNIEKQLLRTKIIRCHRSFMVNANEIETIKKTSSGFDLIINKLTDITIPVSKTYISEFRKFTNKLTSK